MNDEKALTLVTEEEERALLAQLDGLDLSPAGLENLEDGDTGMPPRLRISQRNRPIELGDVTIPGGHIANMLTGENAPSLDIVVLVFLSRTRVMWPGAFSADNAPMCLSDDGKVPLSNGSVRSATHPQSGPCATCPQSQFDDGGAPACKLQRNFLVYIPDAQEAAILTLSSTALKPARQLTTLARTGGLQRTIKMTTQEVKSDKGNWFVPAFTKGRKLATTEILDLVQARDELKNLIVTADLQDVAPEQQNDSYAPSPEPEEEFPF